MAMTYEFTDDMGEISGMGGPYEVLCRKMLFAGLDWLDAHPGELDAGKLGQALIDASKGECNAAQHGAVMDACLMVRRDGWAAYQARMRAEYAEEEKRRGSTKRFATTHR
jgi:hypothetical protein